MIQHYVPRVYLKNFSVKKKKEYFIDVYEKETSRTFNTNIKNICAERDLYTINNDDPYNSNPLVIEDGYSKLFEPMYEEAYQLLVNDNVVQITQKQRFKILIAVFQFYFRNTKILNESLEFHVEQIQSKFKTTRQNGLGTFKYLGKEFYILKDDNEQIKEFESEVKYKYKTVHTQGYAELIEKNSNQIITIYKLIDESKFITSDNPLKNSNIDKISKSPFQKISQFTLPLNDKYALFLHNNRNLSKLQIHREPSFNGKASIVNGHMINNSQKFILGSKAEIEKELGLQEMINTEYETNDEKFIILQRDILKVMKIQKGPPKLIKLTEEIISNFDEKGFLTKEERHKYYNEGCTIMENNWESKI